MCLCVSMFVLCMYVRNRLIQSLKYEAEIHRQLRHPNIVSMLGVVFEPGNYGIVLEFVTYGSWSSFLAGLKGETGTCKFRVGPYKIVLIR